jgi:hypothetical protein
VVRHQTLLLVCDERLDLAVKDSCPLSFVHNSHHFKNIRGQDFNGFYDFLRNNSANILGISFSVFPGAEFLLDSFRSFSYVQPVDSTILRIFFGQDRNFSPSISIDQYFGENRVYRATSGKIALSFSLAPLAPSEARSIPATTTSCGEH